MIEKYVSETQKLMFFFSLQIVFLITCYSIKCQVMVTKIFKPQGDIYRLFTSQRHFQKYIQFHLICSICLGM